jgi:uncharacterized phage protein gp47/JayE
MATRTTDQVVIDLITTILRKYNKADIMSGQVLRDIVVDAPAQEMSKLYTLIDSVSTAQSISNAKIMSTTDLNNLVSNFGVIRKTATKAYGTVTFYTQNRPTQDIKINAGTSLGTGIYVSGKEVTFSTRFDILMKADAISQYYDNTTGYYQVDVDVIADISGTNSNVGPYTITKIRTGGISLSVTNNSSISGGVDEESNEDLAVRTLASFLSNNAGTKSGYLGTILAEDGVVDALLQGPNDPLMTRDGGQGGKVDVWCQISDNYIIQVSGTSDSSLQIIGWDSTIQSLTYGNKFQLPYKPVYVDADDNVSPITITASAYPSGSLTNILLYEKSYPAPSGLSYIDPSGSFYHYQFIKADDLEEAHSINANDYIEWNPTSIDYIKNLYSGNSLDIFVSYKYNEKINLLQNILNADDKHIITADVLVKEAKKITVNVSASVELESDYKETTSIESTTIGNIITAVKNYINNSKLGSKIEESDIVQIIHNVTGVDNVILNSIVITKSRSPYYDEETQTITDITSAENEYFVAGENIIITSV